jgi:Big-like domain-containing protein
VSARARSIAGLFAAIAAAVAIAAGGAGAAPPPISGTHPWIVALCKFTDLSTEPSTYTPAYFNQMFAGVGYSGSLDFQHWWPEISYGNLSVAGTKVTTKWYSLGMTRFEWAGLNRYDKIRTCGDAAALDPNIGNDYSKYYGIVAIFNDDVVPGSGTPARTASTTLTGGNLNMSNTTINVASSAGFPTPPFAVTIDDGSLPNGGNAEELHVTGVVGTTWTLSTRGYEGTTPKNHNNGAAISLIDGGDLGNSGGTAIGVTLNGKPYTLGMVVLPPETNMGATQHETGHGFGYAHSRALSTPTADYNDCYDIMSFDSCDYNFQGDFGSAGVLGDSLPAAVGPGLDAINLDIQSWMPGGRTFSFSPGSCSQTTRDLAALNHPEASGDMEVRVPAAVTIPLPTPPGGTTSTDYYTIELRDKSLWDRAIPQNSVLLHLHGLNGVSYWVDVFNGSTVGHGGALYLADEFVDAGNNVVVAVNRMNTLAHTATIAMATGGAGCKINASAAYSGDTTADFNDLVTLAADLTVAGTSVPVPNANVTLSLGTQSCPATTDVNGHAQCSFTITQHPGTYSASVSYAGDSAYNASTSTATNNFTITKEESQVTYTGGKTADYHDSVTASATLVDPDGGAPIANKPIVFTLNGVDTCTDTTDGAGVASCPINPTQPAGSYTLVAAFAGDVDYLPSSASTPFTVTREETTTAYSGPTVILGGSGAATLTARLQEDGANDDDSDPGNTGPPSPSGQPVTLSLGSQSCTGFADPSGNVQCMINPVIVPLGPEPLKAEFLGDAFYLPSADTSKTAIVFAFPSRGAFVLGDLTTLAAPPLVTWWSHSWPTLNDLSGGLAPASFKGFADDVSSLPTKSPANVCGTSLATHPGNSSDPVPAIGIPSYMGVLVASSITKTGSQIDGTWSAIVVVQTDGGYAPNPGHPGTGSIVATFCS